ncbi:hypothetical protein LINGRAHAP2_LOCUS34957 [Linum grandiflorum]
MVDLESDVFLATFDDSHDYFHALTGAPWMILGYYLTILLGILIFGFQMLSRRRWQYGFGSLGCHINTIIGMSSKV